MTAENFFIKPGYQARSQAVLSEINVALKPDDVYALAATLAHQYECQYIIDLGCGRGHQLATLYPQWKIIGLDSASQLQHCRQQYPFGQWLAFDLQAGGVPDIAPQILQNALIINANVIEHLHNPTGIIKLLHQWLVHAKVALLSTPQRQPQDNGPPAQHSQVRQWNAAELVALLDDAGLPVAYCGPIGSAEQLPHNMLAILPSQQLSAASINDLGTFCQHWLKATPSQRAAADQRDRHHLELAQLQREVSSMPPLSSQPAPSLLNTGIAQINSAQYEEAFALLSKALQQEPGNADVVFQLGRLAAICNMHKDAKELFYQASLRKPEVVLEIVDFYIRQVQDARAGKL